MRFKAILAEAARKRYPLSILLIVLGILIIPFPWLFIRFGLELTGAWWTWFISNTWICGVSKTVA